MENLTHLKDKESLQFKLREAANNIEMQKLAYNFLIYDALKKTEKGKEVINAINYIFKDGGKNEPKSF